MTFSYSGTANISDGQSVFGETASTVPVNVALTYDTSLVTGPPNVIPVGTSLNGYTFADNWFGYNRLGITDLSASFGSKVWNTDDPVIQANDDLRFFADVVFNADIGSDTPTASFLTLADSDGIFRLGNGIVTGAQAVIDSSIRVSDFGAGTFALGQDLRVQKIDPQARYAEPHVPQVPENLSTLLMLFCSVGLLAFVRWQEERKHSRELQRIALS